MPESTHARVARCLSTFLESTGQDPPKLEMGTDLVAGLGLSSDEGLDLVLDLCEEFGHDFPKDFNPLVHPSGRRGRRLGELVNDIDQMIASKEAA